MLSLEEVVRRPGNYEEWDRYYRNSLSDLRTRATGSGLLPSYDSDARLYLASVMQVVEMAQHHISSIDAFYGKGTKVLDDVVSTARAMARMTKPMRDISGPGADLFRMRSAVVSGEAWHHAWWLKKILTGQKEPYENMVGQSFSHYFEMCAQIIESYAVLWDSLDIPKKPVTGESVTAIDPNETRAPWGDS